MSLKIERKEKLNNADPVWKKQGEVRYKTVEHAGRKILLMQSDQEHSLAVMRNGELLIALGKTDDEQEIIEWALAAARNGEFHLLEKALQEKGGCSSWLRLTSTSTGS